MKGSIGVSAGKTCQAEGQDVWEHVYGSQEKQVVWSGYSRMIKGNSKSRLGTHWKVWSTGVIPF